MSRLILRCRYGLGGRAASLKSPDEEMHPEERNHNDSEEQEKATRPKPGNVLEDAERDRHDEATQAAHHPDDAADSADVLRIVGWDVLVDGCLAEAHEEAEDKEDYDKRR